MSIIIIIIIIVILSSSDVDEIGSDADICPRRQISDLSTSASFSMRSDQISEKVVPKTHLTGGRFLSRSNFSSPTLV